MTLARVYSTIKVPSCLIDLSNDSCGIPLVVVSLQDMSSLCKFSKLRTSGRKCGFGSFDCKYNWNLLSYSISSGPSFKNMGPWPLLITWKHTFEIQINFTWKMPEDEANGSTCWMQMHKTHNIFFAVGLFPPSFHAQSVKGPLGIAVAQVQHRSHPPGPLDSHHLLPISPISPENIRKLSTLCQING